MKSGVYLFLSVDCLLFFGFFSFFQNANFSFVFTSFNILLVHLANMVDAFTLFNLFFSSDDDDDWSSSDESDDENKEKLQALSQKMAELKQAEQKIWLKIMADRSKINVLQYLLNSVSSTEEQKKKALAMLMALIEEEEGD